MCASKGGGGSYIKTPVELGFSFWFSLNCFGFWPENVELRAELLQVIKRISTLENHQRQQYHSADKGINSKQLAQQRQHLKLFLNI